VELSEKTEKYPNNFIEHENGNLYDELLEKFENLIK